jgi:hypothetical protein
MSVSDDEIETVPLHLEPLNPELSDEMTRSLAERFTAPPDASEGQRTAWVLCHALARQIVATCPDNEDREFALSHVHLAAGWAARAAGQQ